VAEQQRRHRLRCLEPVGPRLPLRCVHCADAGDQGITRRPALPRPVAAAPARARCS
jgi:hypothetical protein